MSLIDAARPATLEIGGNPPASTGRLVEAEVRPGVRTFRVFKDAAPAPHRGQRGGKASAIVALHLADTGQLDMERLTGPELPPPLARRMRDNRVRPGIEPRVAVLVPRVESRTTEVATAFGDVEGAKHFSPLPPAACDGALAWFFGFGR